MKCVDFNSWKSKCLQLFKDNSKKGTEILKATCTRCEHISRMQPLHLKPLLPRWKVFAQSPTAEKWCGMIFIQYLSRVLPVTRRGTHKRFERGDRFSSPCRPNAVSINCYPSVIPTDFWIGKRRNDNKYATRCYSSARWRRDFRARLSTGRKSWKTVREKEIKILFSVDVLLPDFCRN